MQVSSRAASTSAQAAAQRLGRGKASLAQDLVAYDPQVTPAVQYAFGNAFICQVKPQFSVLRHAMALTT